MKEVLSKRTFESGKIREACPVALLQVENQLSQLKSHAYNPVQSQIHVMISMERTHAQIVDMYKDAQEEDFRDLDPETISSRSRGHFGPVTGATDVSYPSECIASQAESLATDDGTPTQEGG